MVETAILFASPDPVYQPIPYPADTPLSSNWGHLLLTMEIKLHDFICIMPRCLCHARSCVLHRAGFTQETVLPCLLFPENCPGGIFLVRQWGHSLWLSHPNHTCIQPWLSPSWLSHCFIQAKNFKEHIKKPLKYNQPSAENHLTQLS